MVTRRAGSTGTYDFAWTSHPASHGFTVGSNADWHPDRAELAEQIRSFLADIDPKDRLSARVIRIRVVVGQSCGQCADNGAREIAAVDIEE